MSKELIFDEKTLCCWMVIGSNHSWGRSKTLAKALRIARSPKEYDVYRVAESAQCCPYYGTLQYKPSDGYAFIESVRKKNSEHDSTDPHVREPIAD